MRLMGVTSIPSPVTGLRAGMQDPPAGDAESKSTRDVHNNTSGSQPSSSRSDARARAVSPPPPHAPRNHVAKPTIVTQPTGVNSRQFVRTDRRYTARNLSDSHLVKIFQFDQNFSFAVGRDCSIMTKLGSNFVSRV